MSRHVWMLACAVGICASVAFAAPGDDKGGPRPGARRPGGDPEERFKAMDADGNGTISLAEFKAAHEKRMAAMKERMGDKFDASRAPNPEETFKKIDADGNGQLTREELKAMAPPGGRPEAGRRGRHKAQKPGEEKK